MSAADARRAAAWLRDLVPRYPLGVEVVMEIAVLIQFAEQETQGDQ